MLPRPEGGRDDRWSLRACDATRVPAEEVTVAAATTPSPKSCEFRKEIASCEARGVCSLLLGRATRHDEAYCLDGGSDEFQLICALQAHFAHDDTVDFVIEQALCVALSLLGRRTEDHAVAAQQCLEHLASHIG